MATENILWRIQNCAAYVAHDDAMDELNSLTRKLEIGHAQFTEMQSEILRLHEALTQANELYNAVEAMNLTLTERIEYANAGDLVTIPRELVLAMEAKMKLYENTLKFISEQTLCTDDKRECVRAANEALESAK